MRAPTSCKTDGRTIHRWGAALLAHLRPYAGPWLACLITFAAVGPMLFEDAAFLGSGTDIISLEYPLHDFALSRLSVGDLPLWNPFHLGGTPFQVGAHPYLSPSFWTGIIIDDTALDIKAGLALHLMFAAFGMALLARRRVDSPWAQAAAGIIFALGAFMVTHSFAGHRRLVFTAAYLPWVIAALDRLGAIRLGAIRLGAVQLGADAHELGDAPTPRRLLASPAGALITAGLLVGLMLLTGHIQVAFFGLLGAGVFVVVDRLANPATGPPGQASWRRAAAAVGWMAAAVAIGVALDAVQWLPTQQSLAYSQRAEGGLAFAASFSSAPANLWTFLVPNLFGNRVDAPFCGNWSFWESAGYVGLVALFGIILCVSLLPWRRWIGMASPVLLGALLCLGMSTVIFEAYVAAVPGAELFRAAGRYVLLVAVFGAWLAAMGIQAWLDAPPSARRRAMAVLVVPAAVIGLTVWIGGFDAPGWHTELADLVGGGKWIKRMSDVDWATTLKVASADATQALLVSVAASIIILVGIGRRGSWRGPAVLALVGLELIAFGGRFWRTTDAERFEWPASLQAWATEAAAADPGLRVLDHANMRLPGRGAPFGISHITGYDIMIPDPYTELINFSRGRSLEHTWMLTRMGTYNGVVNLLGARYLLTRVPVGARHRSAPRGFDSWSKVGNFQGVHVYENPRPAPRAFVAHAHRVASSRESLLGALRDDTDPTDGLPLLTLAPLPAAFEMQPAADAATDADADTDTDTARIVHFEPDEVIIEASLSAAGAVILSDNWHPGWRAAVDGADAPVIQANHAMRAVPVAAGRHRIVLSFRPAPFIIGAWISGATALLLLLASLRLWLWRRRLKASMDDGDPALVAAGP